MCSLQCTVCSMSNAQCAHCVCTTLSLVFMKFHQFSLILFLLLVLLCLFFSFESVSPLRQFVVVYFSSSSSFLCPPFCACSLFRWFDLSNKPKCEMDSYVLFVMPLQLVTRSRWQCGMWNYIFNDNCIKRCSRTTIINNHVNYTFYTFYWRIFIKNFYIQSFPDAQRKRGTETHFLNILFGHSQDNMCSNNKDKMNVQEKEEENEKNIFFILSLYISLCRKLGLWLVSFSFFLLLHNAFIHH